MQTEIAKGAARVTSLGLDIDVVDGFGAFVRGSTGKTYLVHRLPDGRLTCTCPDAVFSAVGHACKHVRRLLGVWSAHRGH